MTCQKILLCIFFILILRSRCGHFVFLQIFDRHLKISIVHLKKFKFKRTELWPWKLVQESEELEGEVVARELTHSAHALTFPAGMLMQSFPPRKLPGASMHNMDSNSYYSLERQCGYRVRQTHVRISTHFPPDWLLWASYLTFLSFIYLFAKVNKDDIHLRRWFW